MRLFGKGESRKAHILGLGEGELRGLKEVSCHVIRTIRQSFGEFHVARKRGFPSITSEELTRPPTKPSASWSFIPRQVFRDNRLRWTFWPSLMRDPSQNHSAKLLSNCCPPGTVWNAVCLFLSCGVICYTATHNDCRMQLGRTPSAASSSLCPNLTYTFLAASLSEP